ncbi:hypothetical protein CDL12_22117 [Handroanthus impetiginosus]|uniref:F-box associated beta-propeller type 3 domain-containing protein n=1 Tax=Handroanthus impetiginosus TaxID=429701 RepID=A0A2G9GJY7_9LAMI|nr:hypothetical protein CDL12_22117 [Handroanthus impetiginosus]
MHILASCNQGIVCCHRRCGGRHRYFVAKPATKQWKSLPDPEIRHHRRITHAIKVLSSCPLHYKIVRLSSRLGCGQSGITRCEIFDSKVWRWKEVQGLQLYPGENIRRNVPAVCDGYCIFWVTTDDNAVAFDETRESFDYFPLPQPVRRNEAYTFMQLKEYQRKCGLVCLAKDACDLELWLIEGRDSLSRKWVKKMVVNLKGLGEIKLDNRCSLGFYNAEIIHIKSCEKFIFYKLQDFSFSYVELPRGLCCADEVFEFRSDLEPMNLRMRIE